MIDFGRFFEWAKLGARPLIALALAAALLLFLPTGATDLLGLTAFISSNRAWIGLAFVLSFSGILSYPLATLGRTLTGWYKNRSLDANRRERLNNLTPAEKEVLRGYLDADTQTQIFSLMNGVVQGLQSKGIIFQSANMGTPNAQFAFNIQPWAWQTLKENRLLLEADSPAVLSRTLPDD